MARNRSHAIEAALTIAMVALIAYGSLYPFNLKPGSTDAGWWLSLVGALDKLTWARAGHGDRVANVLLYAPLGFCLALWFDNRLRQRFALVIATLIGLSLSYCIEVTQVFISSRVPSWWDVTFNTSGAFSGALGGVAWRALSARLPNSLANKDSRGDRVAIAVLVLWFAWRWAPFAPLFTLTKLKTALQPLFEPHVTLNGTIFYLVYWSAVAQLVFSATSAQRGVEMLLASIAAVLAVRLFVIDAVFIPSELMALVLLLPTLVLLHRLWPPSRRIFLLVAFAMLFIFERLAPFTWHSSAARFDLWPFHAWIEAGMSLQPDLVLKQLFECAMLIWLLNEAGFALQKSVWAVPVGMLALEVIALWMPGREGSITAPVLALVTAMTLRYIARNARRSGVSFIPQRARNR